jgi:probable F420-dependent oxidoreductase
MDRLQIGFVTGAARDEVAGLEALAIDSLWVGGHLSAPNPTPEAMVQLARLSALTERVRVGTSILLLPLYPPAIVAKQIAELDRASGGRVSLGIGVGGEYEQEFRAVGVPVKERGRRTDESIGLIRRLWSAEEVSHPGPFYPMEQVRIHPAPTQVPGPPIIVAGRKDPAMVRAARLGDGWFPYLYSPRAYAASIERIRAVAQEAGRDLARFEWMVFLFANVRDDPQVAKDELVEFLGGTYRQDFRQMLERVAAAGGPAEVAARVQEYVDLGVRHIVFALPGSGDRLALAQRLLSEVVPRLKVPAAGEGFASHAPP